MDPCFHALSMHVCMYVWEVDDFAFTIILFLLLLEQINNKNTVNVLSVRNSF